MLFALSVLRSYAAGHHRTMYDNPIYRWRESLAIALSRMQPEPLHGYLAYRSIHNYLTQHGLGLMKGEVDPLPNPSQLKSLVFDGARMNQLMRDASQVAVDPSLPPVRLEGNELGLADFYYWAFELFGIRVGSLAALYYAILLVSVLMFFLTFHRSPFAILLLMLYLAVHFYMVGFAKIGDLVAVHNSRFFPILSFLPAMHLLLLLLRRERPRPVIVAMAAGQCFILMFLVFCRTQAAWQVVAILACTAVIVRYGALWQAVRRPRMLPAAATVLLGEAWPALVVAAGLVVLTLYMASAPDRRYYQPGSNAHVFWHSLYDAMISATPALAPYRYGDSEDYGDNISYSGVLHDLRARNDASRDIVSVVDGVLTIDPMKNMAEYDQLVRRVFFSVLAEHPWQVLRSFLLDKPRAQFSMIRQLTPFFEPTSYVAIVGLALGSIVLALTAGAAPPRRDQVLRALPVVLILVACSSTTFLVVPNVFIVDTVAFYMMLALITALFVPSAFLWRWAAARIAARAPTATDASYPGAASHGIAPNSPTVAL